MLKFLTLLISAIACSPAFGQGGTIDFSNENSTNVFANHEREPGGCRIPEIYWNTVALKFRVCGPTANHWSDFITAGVVATASVPGQSASIGTTNLLVNGVMAPVGLYRMIVWAEPVNGHTGSGTVAPTASWHSEGATYTIVGNPLSLAAVLTTSYSVPITFHHDGTTHISYSTTYTATGQYSLYVTLEKLQ